MKTLLQVFRPDNRQCLQIFCPSERTGYLSAPSQPCPVDCSWSTWLLPSLLPTTSVVLTADSALNLDNSTQTPAVKLDPVVSRESGAGNRVRINEPVKSQVDSIMETPAKPQPVSTWVSEKPETGWQVPVEQSISPDPTSGQDSALVRGSVELSCSGSEPDSGEESDCSDKIKASKYGNLVVFSAKKTLAPI